MKKILIFGLCMILVSQLITGIGVAPADPEIFFEPNSERTLDLIIINNEEREMTVLINVDSNFSVIPETNTLFFEKGEREKNLKVKIRMPQEMEPGPNIAKISVSEEAKPGMISAFITVVSKLTVFAPYPGKYLKANLLRTDFKPGRKGNFILEIEDLGQEQVETAKIELKVKDEAEILRTQSSEAKNIERRGTYHKVPWIVDLKPGVYEAEALVEFAAPSFSNFKVGEQTLEIKNIKAELDERATIYLTLLNNWNKNLDQGYAEIDFIKDNKNFGRSPTQIVSFEKYEEKELIAYWDTSVLNPGLYEMKVKLFYLNKIDEFEFKALLTEKDLIIQGFAVEKEKEASPMLYIIIAILILIIAGIVLYVSNKKSR